MLRIILMEKNLFEDSTKKKLKKRNQKRFRVEKVVQRKSNYSYFTWKVCSNWFTD